MDKMIELAALKTIREGYVAENMQRAACGHSMAYSDQHFFELAEQMRALYASEPCVQVGRANLGTCCGVTIENNFKYCPVCGVPIPPAA